MVRRLQAEHRFVLARGGETQDFRAYTDATAAAEPAGAAA